METKECPFKKNHTTERQDTIVGEVWSGEWGYQVRCIMCGAKGPICRTKTQATKEWNRR